MVWRKWCHKQENHYAHFGSYRYVEIHGLSYPIVEVELTEDPEGSYYGWVEDNATLDVVHFMIKDYNYTNVPKVKELSCTEWDGNIFEVSGYQGDNNNG